MFLSSNRKFFALPLLYLGLSFGVTSPTIHADKIIDANGQVVKGSIISRFASFLNKKLPTPAHKVTAFLVASGTVVLVCVGGRFCWKKLKRNGQDTTPTSGQTLQDSNNNQTTAVTTSNPDSLPPTGNNPPSAGQNNLNDPAKRKPAEGNLNNQTNNAGTNLSSQTNASNTQNSPMSPDMYYDFGSYMNERRHLFNTTFKDLLPAEGDDDKTLQKKLEDLISWDPMTANPECNAATLHDVHIASIHYVAAEYFKPQENEPLDKAIEKYALLHKLCVFDCKSAVDTQEFDKLVNKETAPERSEYLKNIFTTLTGGKGHNETPEDIERRLDMLHRYPPSSWLTSQIDETQPLWREYTRNVAESIGTLASKKPASKILKTFTWPECEIDGKRYNEHYRRSAYNTYSTCFPSTVQGTDEKAAVVPPEIDAIFKRIFTPAETSNVTESVEKNGDLRPVT